MNPTTKQEAIDLCNESIEAVRTIKKELEKWSVPTATLEAIAKIDGNLAVVHDFIQENVDDEGDDTE